MRNTTWSHFVGASEAGGSWERVKEECAIPVLRYIPFLLVSYAISTVLVAKTTGWKGLKLQKLAGAVSMYPAFLVLIYYSHATMLDHRFWSVDHVSRSLDSASEIDMFANFYIATNIVQAVGQMHTERPPLLYQLMGHHVLSIFCYAASFYFGRLRWWAALAGCCEITNLFLVPVFACKEYFPEWKTETWYLWNTRLLWVTFVTHRLVLFPCWLGLWIWDGRRAAEADEPMEIHWIEGILYPVTIIGLLVLSIVWFLAIDRGLRKQKQAWLEARVGKKSH